MILKERITTTEARAKAMRPVIERLVARNSAKTIAARRNTVAFLGNDVDVAKKLAEVIGPRYASRKGGYVRVVKLGQRRGDGSPMARIEFV